MEQSQEHKTAATSLHYTYCMIRIFYYIIYEVVHTDIFLGIFGIVSSIVLFLYFIIQPYKPKYAVCNKVTLTMITAIVLTMFSAVNVVIANNKMYQAVSLSIALLSISFFVPLLYIICIAMSWIGIGKLLSPLKLLIMNTDKSQISSKESALINGEDRVQSLYNTVSLNQE